MFICDSYRYDRWDLLVNKYVFSQELDDVAKTNNRYLVVFLIRVKKQKQGQNLLIRKGLII